MKLIIDIDENMYKSVSTNDAYVLDDMDFILLENAIAEGIPLEDIRAEIEKLEQEPCEDCISREEAKQFLYERIDRLNDDELYDIFSRIIDDMYNELSSVKQESKTNVFDEIKVEILEYIDDLDISYEICGIFDKYKAESEEV